MLDTLNTAQIDELLYSQVLGRLGCADNGKVYIIPINYAYDGKYIYAHSKEGLKTSIMRRNMEVCFEVDCFQKTGSWKSAILWGTFEELKTVKEQKKAMEIFIRKMTELIKDERALPTHGFVKGKKAENDPFKSIVFRIAVREKTGRCEIR